MRCKVERNTETFTICMYRLDICLEFYSNKQVDRQRDTRKQLRKHRAYELSNLSEYPQQVTGGRGFLRSFLFQSPLANTSLSCGCTQYACGALTDSYVRKYSRLMKVDL